MTEPKAYVTTEEFIRLLKVGTDWGGAVEIIWRSPSKRYIIWQVKGHKAWAGIGNKWEYEPTVYRLADLDRMEQRPDGSNIGGIGIGHDCTIDTVVGRLSHDNRVEWMKKCVYGFPKGWRGVDEQGRIIGA